MGKKKKRKLGYLHPLYVPQGIERIVTLAGQIFGKVGKIERALASGDKAGPYRYFISWSGSLTGSNAGSGIVKTENLINTQEDLKRIEDNIKKEWDCYTESDFPVISNFILLDPEK